MSDTDSLVQNKIAKGSLVQNKTAMSSLALTRSSLAHSRSSLAHSRILKLDLWFLPKLHLWFLPPLVYAHRAGPKTPKINGGRGANT
jgi:hypothetical protein